MMVCVFAMRELTLLSNFYGDYEIPGKTWTMDEYPQVTISVGNPYNVVTVRFAMWTIASAIRDMVARMISDLVIHRHVVGRQTYVHELLRTEYN